MFKYSGAGIEIAAVVIADGLTKSFKGQKVVDGLSFEVQPGRVFGLLGPNGSGKTTTIRMLLGLIAQDKGQASILGERVHLGGSEVLKRVGSFIEGPGFPPHLTGEAALARLAIARGEKASVAHRLALESLQRVGLSEAASKRIRSYSLGMRQRLGIAQALLYPRDLYILDEPTNGLDPSGMREVRSIISRLAEEGSAVVLSSHLLNEVEAVCSDVVIISRGRLVRSGTIAEVMQGGDKEVVFRVAPIDGAKEAITGRYPQLSVEVMSSFEVAVKGESVDAASINELLVGLHYGVSGITERRTSLEEIFVDLTGEGFDVR